MSDRNIGYDAAPPPERKAKVVYRCGNCGSEIFEGESYYYIAGWIICEDCINDFMEIA